MKKLNLIVGFTYPTRNSANLRQIPKLINGMPETINAWVLGIGGPGTVLQIGNRNIEAPITIPALAAMPYASHWPKVALFSVFGGHLAYVPTEHIEVANAIRKAGKTPRISVVDFSRINLSYAKTLGGVHRMMLKKNPPRYSYPRIDLNKMKATPSTRPHVILAHNQLIYLPNPGEAFQQLAEALHPGGLFMANKDSISDLKDRGLIPEKDWDIISPTIIRKKQ